MSREKTRITAFVEDELAREFTERARQLGISGTALLNRGLPAELDYLAELPFSERAAAVWRSYEAVIDAVGASFKRRRINITLDREEAERMDQICREKRVPRDVFIGFYLDFLVNGAEGVCEAPLKRASEILMNPRHEYEEKRKNGPTADETLYNPETEEYTLIKAVPQENPYSGLHMLRHAFKFLDEEQLDLWVRLTKENRTPENR
jgi:post-segregation antitoxin (ccd killing protein)